MKKIIFSLAFLFIVHCTLIIEHCVAQWYPLPQFPTYLETSDVKFFDENTGVLVTQNPSTIHGILRTTNGGNNWVQIKNCYNYDCQKIDSTTFFSVSYNFNKMLLYRTFDKGETWDSVAVSDNGYNRLYFINRDTGWVSGWNGGVPYIWKTTNGGVNLTVQAGSNVGGGEIFFYNKKVNGEYIGWVNNYDELWKTTNSGNNWFLVASPGTELIQISFVDENTGWASKGNMYKTTNGGLNWINQPLAPGGGNKLNRSITKFIIIDGNLLYGVGGYRYLPNMRPSAIIWKTTNGGINWGYQETDSSYHLGFFNCVDFINAETGWTFQGNGVHTTNGGGTIIFTNIRNDNLISNNFELYQNYPNPFNPETNISYNIRNKSNVKIIVYDIIGKEIETLVNEIKQSGSYTIKFDANKLSSGIYFYSLIIDGITAETKKMILIR